MLDRFSRKIEYMRISVTDRCNLRCRYCMGDGIRLLPMADILTYEEIIDVAKAALSLGITKFRITGGEPLVRKGCTDLISNLKKLPGTEQVLITTNGVLLEDSLKSLMDAGTDGINVSLDTLDRERFRYITGFDALEKVTRGIKKAVDTGIPIKVNSVLQPGVNDDEWKDLAEIARDLPIDVRFIEMMPIGEGARYESVSNDELLKKIITAYPGYEADNRVHGNGPAKYIKIKGFKGSIGLISAIHNRFCSSCNRIRLTSTGKLKPCLCYGETLDVREILRDPRSENREQKLLRAIKESVMMKPEMHCFEEKSNITEISGMSSIGG